MGKEKLKYAVSMMLACVMTLSGLTAYFPSFAEEGPEKETEANTELMEEQTAETEPVKYLVTLPFFDGCSYHYQEEHLKEEKENGDCILWYEAGEEVELFLQPDETVQIREAFVQNSEKKEMQSSWDPEEIRLSFEMPDQDVWVLLEIEEALQTEEDLKRTKEIFEEETETSVAVEDNSESPDFYKIEGTMTSAENETNEEQGNDPEIEPVIETEAETDADGLPPQGSVVMVEAIILPFDTWTFDPENDFTNIDYDWDRFSISYVSDDIAYDMAGTYSSIYRVTGNESGKFWFVLRPVIVSEEGEGAGAETESESEAETESETTQSDPDETEDAGTEEADSPEETEEELHLATLKIHKENIDGAALGGVSFQITELNHETGENAPSFISWDYKTDENGGISVDGLSAGIYKITETSTLPGYLPYDTPRFVTVSADGLIFESDSEGNAAGDNAEATDAVTLTWINDYTKWEIHKKDMTGEELAGATLQLLDAGGNVVEEWVSEKDPHRINTLPTGDYTLTEKTAPEGYVLASPIPFTVTESKEVQSITMIDKQLFIVKTDVFIEELAGAELEVKDENGRVVDAWTSDGTAHALRNLEVGKTYILSETKAPEGYAAASDIPFTVSDDAGDDRITLINKQVFVHKTDTAGKKELAGASLSITTIDGILVDEWETTDEPHPVSGIRVNETYILTETHAPAGYAIATRIEFSVSDDGINQEIVMTDEEIELTVSKKDAADNEELPGADLQIYDSEKNLVDEWVSEGKPHKTNLAAGSYTLTEKTAPAGYATAEPLEFVIDENQAEQQVILFDSPIQLQISKKNITNDEELPGAHLIIKDENSVIVDDWTSADQPHVLTNLPTGRYILIEVTAPEGYEVAESVAFTVEDDRELQYVTMYDSPKESRVDLTGKISTETAGTPSVMTAAPISGSGGTVTASPVKTGDRFRYFGSVLLIGCGGALLAVLYLKKKKRK